MLTSFNNYKFPTKFMELYCVFLFFFLLIIGIFGGFFNCVYFLITLQKNVNFLFINKIAFITCCVYQFFNPKFGFFVIQFLISNPLWVNYSNKCVLFLEKNMKKNPFLIFLFFHFFISLTFLHFLMLIIDDFDVRLEYLYQIFNLIKVSLLPAFVLVYVINLSPVVFKMETVTKLAELALDPTRREQLMNFFNEISGTLKSQGKKHPLISGAILLGSLTVGGLHMTGHYTSSRIQQDLDSAGIDPNLINPSTYLADAELQRLIKEFFRLNFQGNNSNIDITITDIIAYFKGTPGLRSQLQEVMINLFEREKIISAEIEENFRQATLEALKQKAVDLKASGSLAASPIVSPSITESIEVDEPSCSSLVSKTNIDSKSEIPVCLEWSFFDLFK